MLDHGSSINKNFWIHSTAAADGKGVKVGVGTGSGAETLQYIFPPADADDWHHVAMTYNGMSLLLYVDGAFAGTKMVTGVRGDSAQVYFGSKTGDTGF
ncbi:MAG: hypothetical protein IPM98_19345 [Lewinellaceae bacterium]|nr:hypothetical protein [Lewinellaceae bacterium]